MNVVEVEGLSKAYGSVAAVRDVTFSVQRGECVGILGPNGAGKSTTVEIVEGFRSRDTGRVSVLGEDPAGAGPAWRARLGIVLQECGFESFLTVREVLSLHAGYYPAPRPVDEVLEICQLTEKASARVLRLSGGQRRKLDVALAIVGNPEIIFLDEPTTGFDPIARRAFWALIGELRESGTTILLTTHFLEEAEVLADRLVLIINGSAVISGTTDALRATATGSDVCFTFPRALNGQDHRQLAELCGGFGARMLSSTDVAISTIEPTMVLAHLTSWAAHHRVELGNLRVERPTLEDVYLRLVEQHRSPVPQRERAS